MKIEEIKEWYIQHEKIYFSSIELTQNCNFKCKHCYCEDKNSLGLTLEQCKIIIDKLHSIGCLFLNFTGGEILTHKQFQDIYMYAKNKGFIIDLLTNASLIDENLIDLFLKFPPNNIAITIYGTNESDYNNFTGNADNYNTVINALTLLKQNNINFVLRTVAANTLRESLMNCDFEKIADRFGTTFKYDPIIFPKTTGDITPLQESMSVCQIIELEKRNEQRQKAWTKAIHKDKPYTWTCSAGISSMTIDHKGDAYVCGLYRNSPISMIDNDIQTVLNHLRVIHEHHKTIVQTNQCSQCDKRHFCKWCPAYSYIYNGNDNEKIGFFCELAKMREKYFG